MFILKPEVNFKSAYSTYMFNGFQTEVRQNYKAKRTKLRKNITKLEPMT